MKRQGPMQAHQLQKVPQFLGGRPGLSPSPLPFLTRTLPPVEGRFENEVPRKVENKVSQRVTHEVSPKASTGATTLPGAVIRSPADILEAHSTQPAMVNLGPMLMLLTMLHHRPRREHVPIHQLSLPPGCVLAVHYASR